MGLQPGKPLFEFAPEKVSELWIEKNDAKTGDHWSATLTPVASTTSEAAWAFQSAGARNLRDRKADGKWILHFLDTLTTLSLVETAPRGGLDSYGMTPPRFALRWKVRDSSASNQETTYEIWLGNQPPRSTSSTDTQSGFVRILARAGQTLTPTTAPVVIAQGAAIQMLDILKEFEVLRNRLLVSIPLDDIDELSVFSGPAPFGTNGSQKRPRVYAQRLGESWGDSQNNPLSESKNRAIEDFTHLRVREFIDDPALAASYTQLLKERPELEIILKDRKNQPTTVRLARIPRLQDEWLASSSDRPDAVFRLHPEATRPLATLVPAVGAKSLTAR